MNADVENWETLALQWFPNFRFLSGSLKLKNIYLLLKLLPTTVFLSKAIKTTRFPEEFVSV